jgi:hypothetical protein
LYADDAAILVNPIKEEVTLNKDILQGFGQASRLITNTAKSAVYPIKCDGIQLQEVMEAFQCQINSFPCKYLGLPLHVRQLRRVDVQPLLDKVAAKLSTWKGGSLNKSGRLRLINTVLTSVPTYYLIVFQLHKWAVKKFDRIRRGFLWKGAAEANGGHCLVRWAKATQELRWAWNSGY